MFLVHPHARGEDIPSAAHSPKVIGSPPRAWGRPAPRPPSGSRRRFTPTRVGKTFRGDPRRGTGPVHPHARGEDSRSRPRAGPVDGSPPRAWGRLRDALNVAPGLRFTPTRVGKTEIHARRPREIPVHPHARGEDPTQLDPKLGFDGSPPRAWGRLQFAQSATGACRFTPTRVGKTRLPSCSLGCFTVHPHARGEDTDTTTPRRNLTGSPPRAWGRLTWLFCALHLWRFTPTRVGKTVDRGREQVGLTVHPHARGEDPADSFPIASSSGSPPRAWGRHQHLASQG